MSLSARLPVLRVRNVYSSTNVTTAAYVELVAALGSNIMAMDIFDSSGETMVIAAGAAGSEVDQFYVMPGGTCGPISVYFNQGQRISVKAVSASATVGEITINGFS